MKNSSIDRGLAELDSVAAGLDRSVKIRCGAEIKPQKIRWLWNGWLPAGKLTILAGSAGTGKTTLACGLAAVITSCGRWPDGTQCSTAGNVLVWSSEDAADDTLVPRLIASGADLSRCHFVEGIAEDGKSVPFDPARDIHLLHQEVLRLGGVSLVIVDPIVSLVSGDMNQANTVRRALQEIVDFAGLHGCGVIGISHFTKGSNGRSPQDRVIGSQAFGALARMVLVAAKEEDSPRRVLARAKSNIAPDEGGVVYGVELIKISDDIETTRVVWHESVQGTAREILGQVEHNESDDGDKSELEQMILDLLMSAGGKMPAKQVKGEISDAGHNWSAANRAKKSLGIQAEKDGVRGGWFWVLPPSSRSRYREDFEDFAQKLAIPSESSTSSSAPFPVEDQI